MRAVEVKGVIGNDGFLKLEDPLEFRNREVKVIILIPEDDILNDNLWLQGIMDNPVFDFLQEEEENIYTLENGKPYQPNEI